MDHPEPCVWCSMSNDIYRVITHLHCYSPDNAFPALYNNTEQRVNIRAVFARILSFCPHTPRSTIAL